MKTLRTFSVLTIGCMLGAVAEVTETEKTTEVNADGSVTETTTTTTFNPEVRTKVLGYFDTHKSHPHGLPPGLAKKLVPADVPTAWRTTVTTGTLINEDLRTHLVEVPSDLQKFLPDADDNVRFYIAGSNVVAVDSEYRVVDSLQIPTVKFSVED